MTKLFPSVSITIAVMLACSLLAACASDPVTDARKHYAEGRTEDSLALLEKTSRADPGNHQARSEYFRVRELVVAQWLGQAEVLRQSGDFDAAGDVYRRIVTYDTANTRARVGLVQIETDKRHRTIVATADRLVKEGKFAEAQDVLRPVLNEATQHREAQRLQRLIDERLVKPAIATIQLKSAVTQPISLELRDVTLRSAFDVLGRASSINFMFDKDVRADQRTTILMRDLVLEDAVRLLLMTNQLEQKIINEKTVVVFPNTPQKLREYQDLVVRAFYLSNADVRLTANMIRTMLKTRDIFIDEKINLLVIKDTPAAIRLAERLIATQDLAESEVMLEIEVLEIASNRLLELGLRFPDSLAWSVVGSEGVAGSLTLPEWLSRNSSMVRLAFNNPLFLLTLRQQDGTTSALANPRIRVKNKEKARVHIGDRLPVITTTAAASGGFISESVNYLDVGLKLEVEPLIYLEDEVGIKVGLEVSNIVREVRGATTNTLTYQIGTRNAATTLRLRDGETQILAGLISDEDRRSASRVPGLGELPVLGRLFSATRGQVAKSEIVLLITPRLLRTMARPEARLMEFAAGTDAVTGAPGAPPGPLPFAPPPAPKPGVSQPPKPTVTPQGTTNPAAPVLVPVPGQPAGLPPTEMVPFGGMQQQTSP